MVEQQTPVARVAQRRSRAKTSAVVPLDITNVPTPTQTPIINRDTTAPHLLHGEHTDDHERGERQEHRSGQSPCRSSIALTFCGCAMLAGPGAKSACCVRHETSRHTRSRCVADCVGEVWLLRAEEAGDRARALLARGRVDAPSAHTVPMVAFGSVFETVGTGIPFRSTALSTSCARTPQEHWEVL